MGSGKRKRKSMEKAFAEYENSIEDINLQEITSPEDFELLRSKKLPNQKQYVVVNGQMIEVLD